MRATILLSAAGLAALLSGCAVYPVTYREVVTVTRVAPLPPVRETTYLERYPAPAEPTPVEAASEGDAEALPPPDEVADDGAWVEEGYVDTGPVPADPYDVEVVYEDVYVEPVEMAWGVSYYGDDGGYGYSWGSPWYDPWYCGGCGIWVGFADRDGHRGHPHRYRGGGYDDHDGRRGGGHDDRDGHRGGGGGSRAGDRFEREGRQVVETTDRQARVRQRENVVRGAGSRESSRTSDPRGSVSGSSGSLARYYDRRRTGPAPDRSAGPTSSRSTAGRSRARTADFSFLRPEAHGSDDRRSGARSAPRASGPARSSSGDSGRKNWFSPVTRSEPERSRPAPPATSRPERSSGGGSSDRSLFGGWRGDGGSSRSSGGGGERSSGGGGERSSGGGSGKSSGGGADRSSGGGGSGKSSGGGRSKSDGNWGFKIRK